MVGTKNFDANNYLSTSLFGVNLAKSVAKDSASVSSSLFSPLLSFLTSANF